MSTEKKKLCPMLFACQGTLSVECLEEKCAWWDARYKTCAVKNLRWLDKIGGT